MGGKAERIRAVIVCWKGTMGKVFTIPNSLAVNMRWGEISSRMCQLSCEQVQTPASPGNNMGLPPLLPFVKIVAFNSALRQPL